MNQPQARNSAETYEHYFVPAMFLPWATILLRYAAPRSRERVLDVACGTGIVARHLSLPAFAQPQAPAREALLETIRVEVEPVIRKYRDADAVTFPMFAHIVVAAT